MARQWAGIYFLLGNNDVFAYRAWENVPRVGEFVVFASDDKPRKVYEVVWREERTEPPRPYAEVYIEPSPIEQVPQ